MQAKSTQLKLALRLEEFRKNNHLVTVGMMGAALVITRRAKAVVFPLNPDGLLTKGGGQVSGLSGRAINRILNEYGIEQSVGTESGRTSRGTPTAARSYANFLNNLHAEGIADLEAIEKWWVDRFIEYFATEPFNFKYDPSKTLRVFVEGLLGQAMSRQKLSAGKMYVGAMLQHLVGAKLELALPNVKVEHHGFEVADAVSARSGDFVIEGAVLHVTTTPSPALFEKCRSNLNAALHPIIVTLPKVVGAVDVQLEQAGMEGRVEAIDAVQLLTVNLYEISLFKTTERKITVENLAMKYNAIVSAVESDKSLLIRIDGEGAG